MVAMSVQKSLNVLASSLEEQYELGHPVTVEGNNSPAKFLIHSLRPLSYETYGRIKNRSPRLVGTCAVESLIWTSHTNDIVVPYAVVPTGQERLGIRLPVRVLNAVSEIVGLPANWVSR